MSKERMVYVVEYDHHGSINLDVFGSCKAARKAAEYYVINNTDGGVERMPPVRTPKDDIFLVENETESVNACVYPMPLLTGDY